MTCFKKAAWARIWTSGRPRGFHWWGSGFRYISSLIRKSKKTRCAMVPELVVNKQKQTCRARGREKVAFFEGGNPKDEMNFVFMIRIHSAAHESTKEKQVVDCRKYLPTTSLRYCPNQGRRWREVVSIDSKTTTQHFQWFHQMNMTAVGRDGGHLLPKAHVRRDGDAIFASHGQDGPTVVRHETHGERAKTKLNPAMRGMRRRYIWLDDRCEGKKWGKQWGKYPTHKH